jgi:hypothetical protein
MSPGPRTRPNLGAILLSGAHYICPEAEIKKFDMKTKL